ncbi:FG-GAP-like repeat-containing protein [Streptomyces sp. NPDC003703]|uniref:FG-GAP-like repeat-containing protein n=1 Tax=Streptomyces sp. NPDC003283 TaxID=3364681 RepID=UPI0036BD4748
MSARSNRFVWGSALGASALLASLFVGLPAGAVTGPEATTNDLAFTARLDIGGGHRACSATLVDPQWLVASAGCFTDDPNSMQVSAGKPKWKTMATIGRTDLTAAGGQVREVVELVPRSDRDLVMARLATPATGITPVAVSTSAPTAGEELKIAGFGRTKAQWAPNKLHTASFTVESVAETTLLTNGKSITDTACAGDAGGPVVRQANGKTELVALSSQSWQAGCLGTDESETRTAALDTRLDDLNAWIQQVRSLPQQAQVTAGDFDGDGKADVAALYDNGKDSQGRSAASLWVFRSDGTALRAPRVVWNSDSSWNWSSSKLTSGDYNGDGKTDIGVLYNYGQTADGINRTKLWIFTSSGDGDFTEPKIVWDSGSTSWNWDSSKLTSGDYNGDGKTDIGVLYNYGQTGDGRNRSGLWAFNSTGNGFQTPVKVWDSGTNSWNWNASKVASGDFNGDGKMDIAVLYNYGQAADGRNQTGLWFAGGADGLGSPKKVWDSDTSWNWNSSTLTTGDYNGDGKTDIGVLYNYGQDAQGRNQTGLWTMAGTATGVAGPKRVWESATSWNWNSSQPVSGDFNGDGKTDLAVFYDYGRTADARARHGLWTFISTGDTMTAPRLDWDSAL